MFEKLEAVLIQIHRQGQGGIIWPAHRIGENKHLLKHLQRLDGGGGNHKKGGGSQQGNGDVAELGKFACSVYGGGFVQFARDGLQPGQEQYRVKPYRLPGGDDDDG